MNERLHFIGLSGLAGAGKTSTADLLAPSIGQFYHDPDLAPESIFTHYVLAAPLYDMVGVIRLTEGDNRQDRILYQLYDIIHPLIGQRIPFDTFIDLIKSIEKTPVGSEYDAKPRQFMISVGDVLREIYIDCFVDKLVRKVYIDTQAINQDYANLNLDAPNHFCVVSDVRYFNELDYLRKTGNLTLVKLDVSFATANKRVLERDGVPMVEDMWNHPTEAGFPEEEYDLIVSTDELGREEVAAKILDFVTPRMPQEINLVPDAV